MTRPKPATNAEIEEIRKRAEAMGDRPIVAQTDRIFQEGREQKWALHFSGHAGKVDSVTAFILACQPKTLLRLLARIEAQDAKLREGR